MGGINIKEVTRVKLDITVVFIRTTSHRLVCLSEGHMDIRKIHLLGVDKVGYGLKNAPRQFCHSYVQRQSRLLAKQNKK